jgi:myo-inositol-1-phosphate synthase
MSTIRVAIAGVGNCASSLIQGVEYYREADPTETVPGLMHVVLGDYHVGDLEFVAAFDADAAKVGTDLGKAIFAGQNNTIRFAAVGELGITVQRGPTLDGFGKYYRETVEESPAEPVDVVAALRESRADVLVSYLPVGSEQAQRFYADACLQAGVGFVNAIPVFIASDPDWARRFRDAGLPIVGDDIKSQVGSTIVHRILTRLFEDRGLALDHTYQLNVGGNMDFKNMLERDRLESKKVSKTQAVTSQIEHGALPADDVHIGPSDHVPWLHDRKWAYIRMEGRNFGDVPLNLELKLEVWDSPNSAGVIIDAVRCAKLARPWHRRAAARTVRLLHEVTPGAVPRRRLPSDGGGVRRRRAQSGLARGLSPGSGEDRSAIRTGEPTTPSGAPSPPPRRGDPRPSSARAGRREPVRRPGPARGPVPP